MKKLFLILTLLTITGAGLANCPNPVKYSAPLLVEETKVDATKWAKRTINFADANESIKQSVQDCLSGTLNRSAFLNKLETYCHNGRLSEADFGYVLTYFFQIQLAEVQNLSLDEKKSLLEDELNKQQAIKRPLLKIASTATAAIVVSILAKLAFKGLMRA